MNEPRRLLNVPRGLLAAVACGLGGALLCAGLLFVAGETVFPEVAQPLVVCGAVGASSGWVAFAPARAWRFTPSLAIVFAGCLGLWLSLGWMELTPFRRRGSQPPVFDPPVLAFLVGPPVAVSILLTVIRVRATKHRADGGPVRES